MKSMVWWSIFFAGLTYSAYAATTATSPPSATTKARPTPRVNATAVKTGASRPGFESRIGSNVANIGTGRVITTRVGDDGVTPQQQCRCVLFYLCDQNDVLEVPSSGAQCAAQLEVCCLLPLSSLNDSSTTTDLNGNFPITPVVTDSTSVTSSQTDDTRTTENPFACRCTPSIQCLNMTNPVDGEGNIDIRTPPACGSQEVCCYPTDILETPTRTDIPVLNPQPTTPTPPTPTSSSPSTTPSSDRCGIRNRPEEGIINRIVGSNDTGNTSFGEFPWMAIVLTSDESEGERVDNLFVCGASVVGPNIIMTAAHCVYQRDKNALKIRVGEYDTVTGSSAEPLPHQESRVLEVYIHSQYNSRVLHNDVALITTEQSFNLTRHISPICIPLLNTEFANNAAYNERLCVATGWGKDAFGPNANYQTVLKKVDLSLVPRAECQQRLRETRLGPHYLLDPSFVCAGGEPGSDTCEGDGGGPLACALRSDPNRYVQVGIVSWGIGCGSQTPAVYASLHSNINWLSEQYNQLTTFSDLTSARSGFSKEQKQRQRPRKV